jgi:transposase
MSKAKQQQKSSKGKGRPTKLNKEIQEKIVSYIRAGNYVETAAAAAGINKKTLYEWLKRGAQAQSGIYKDFSNAVGQAQALSEVEAVEELRRHSLENAQTIEWRLERRFPTRWGRKDRLQADINSQHTEREEIIAEQRLTADDEARELLRQLFRKQMELERAGD